MLLNVCTFSFVLFSVAFFLYSFICTFIVLQDKKHWGESKIRWKKEGSLKRNRYRIVIGGSQGNFLKKSKYKI